MIIYFVRHAIHALVTQALCGRSDTPLSYEGRAQADSLAAQFSRKQIDLVQSSPRRRAGETAKPIAAATRNVVQTVGQVDELDTGEWTGRSFESLSADPRWDAWNSAREEARPPGGESMGELQARVLAHLEVLRSCGKRSAVIVTHAEPIRAALLHYLAMPLRRFAEIQIDPASISVLRRSRKGLRVEEINLQELP
jgi:broad specificity phosphatase PhoE